MSTSTPNLKQLAEEAEFQMLAAKNLLDWHSALARAISRDVEHNSGRDVAELAQLATYLGDTGSPGTESAIEMFGNIARSESAPQNADLPNRGAHAAGASQ